MKSKQDGRHPSKAFMTARRWMAAGLLAVFCQQPVAAAYAAWTTTNTKGETWTSADGNVKTYARPDGYTWLDGSPRFNVMVNGTAYTGLYSCNNPRGSSVNFGYFDFRDGTPVEVVVSCRRELGDYDLLPAGADVTNVEQLTGKMLRFTITRANQWITLVLGGDYQTGDVLHLFCNDIDEAPTVAKTEGYSYDRATKTYYFGPGYYDLSTLFSNGMLTASAGRNIYLAGGAVVKGNIGLSGNGSKIYGHGMVLVDEGNSGSELSCSWAGSGEVDGILCHRFKVKGWQTTYTGCKNLHVSNLKIISPSGGSTDGMDLTACEGLTFDNCFVRANDDCVAIKGLAADGSIPANQAADRNLTFRRMQLWSDSNNAFGIGAETYASAFENIRLEDSDILCAYDEKSITEGMADRSAINICALEGTYFHDIHYDNIRVNHCTRLFALGFEDSFWYRTIIGNQTFPGEIRDVHFSNITCPVNTGTPVSNDIWLYGWYKDGTPTKHIHDIYFDNVVIEGELLDGWDNRHLKTNNTTEHQLVYDLHFNTGTGIGNEELRKKNEDRYSLVERSGGTAYDLQGRRIDASHGAVPHLKGIVVRNGKKVIE